MVPVLQEGVDHAAVDDGQDQPHQHGHDVLGESISKAVFVGGHSAPWRRGAAVTQQQVQRVRRGGVQEHLVRQRSDNALVSQMFHTKLIEVLKRTKDGGEKARLKHLCDQRTKSEDSAAACRMFRCSDV